MYKGHGQYEQSSESHLPLKEGNMLFTNLVIAAQFSWNDFWGNKQRCGSWNSILTQAQHADGICNHYKIEFTKGFQVSIHDVHALVAAYFLLYLVIPGEMKLSTLFIKAVKCGIVFMFFNKYIYNFMQVFNAFMNQSKFYNETPSVFSILFMVYTITILSASNKVYWFLYAPAYAIFFVAYFFNQHIG